MQVDLDPFVAGIIAACVRCAHGAEVCGYLMEDDGGRQQFFALENRLASRDGCFVASGDVHRAHRYAAKHGLRVRDLVHSHSTGTSLSDVDRMGLAESDVPWIVVCLTEAGLLAERYLPGDGTARQR
jgi:proteasome lid subunit RPN8/RPN11